MQKYCCEEILGVTQQFQKGFWNNWCVAFDWFLIIFEGRHFFRENMSQISASFCYM